MNALVHLVGRLHPQVGERRQRQRSVRFDRRSRDRRLGQRLRADLYQGSVQKFSPSDHFVRKWSTLVPWTAERITRDGAGNVYVAGFREIAKFTPTRDFITLTPSASSWMGAMSSARRPRFA
jgi:hypothetical protein